MCLFLMLSELSLGHHQDQSAVVMWCTVHGGGEGQVLLENVINDNEAL